MNQNDIHPWVKEVAEEVNAGKVNKRNFLKYASFKGTPFHIAGRLVGLHSPAEIKAEAGYDWHVLDEESPFEVKNLLKEKAEDARARAQAKGEAVNMLDAGRGNPDFLNTTVRMGTAELMLFAAMLAEQGVDTPDLGFRVGKSGLADNLRAFMDREPVSRGRQFLQAALAYAETKLGMDPDEVAFELVDGVQADYYPDPPRIFPVTEAIVNQYLNRVVFSGQPPEGKFHLFATEGATGAMVYLFNSLKMNKVLKSGDHIAIMTPIFSPYLEIPVLQEYSLVPVYIESNEDMGWQIPDGEIAKLADPKVRALFMVNPTNPTSVSLDEKTVTKIAETVKTHNQDMIVISDTVYASFVDEFHDLSAQIPENTFGVYSFSKYFGVTGWRLGVIMIHDDCVVDKIIAGLSKRDQAILDMRYRLTSTDPETIKFYDRLEMDSRDVALAHTGGISGPQQVAMCLFSLFELMDTEFAYKKTIQDILKKRWNALFESLGLATPEGSNLTRYYAMIDLARLAETMHGKEFADHLTKGPALAFLFRLADTQSTICLPGQGFAGPAWSLRVALANIKEDDCTAIGQSIRAVMDQYYAEFTA